MRPSPLQGNHGFSGFLDQMYGLFMTMISGDQAEPEEGQANATAQLVLSTVRHAAWHAAPTPGGGLACAGSRTRQHPSRPPLLVALDLPPILNRRPMSSSRASSS